MYNCLTAITIIIIIVIIIILYTYLKMRKSGKNRVLRFVLLLIEAACWTCALMFKIKYIIMHANIIYINGYIAVYANFKMKQIND